MSAEQRCAYFVKKKKKFELTFPSDRELNTFDCAEKLSELVKKGADKKPLQTPWIANGSATAAPELLVAGNIKATIEKFSRPDQAWAHRLMKEDKKQKKTKKTKTQQTTTNKNKNKHNKQNNKHKTKNKTKKQKK